MYAVWCIWHIFNISDDKFRSSHLIRTFHSNTAWNETCADFMCSFISFIRNWWSIAHVVLPLSYDPVEFFSLKSIVIFSLVYFLSWLSGKQKTEQKTNSNENGNTFLDFLLCKYSSRNDQFIEHNVNKKIQFVLKRYQTSQLRFECLQKWYLIPNWTKIHNFYKFWKNSESKINWLGCQPRARRYRFMKGWHK